MQQLLFKVFILCSLGLMTNCNSQSIPETVAGDLNIAPLPVKMKPESGVFVIDERSVIYCDTQLHKSFNPLKVFIALFEEKSGYALQQKGEAPASVTFTGIQLQWDSTLHAEGYDMMISASGIHIKASQSSGAFYAMQTLRQIMKLDVPEKARQGNTRRWSVPNVIISDYPQFGYRGLHLDVVRHFMPLSFVRRYIDLMSYYKLNRFHWHLTDDQGWRIEIKKYPRLQEVAAWRDETLIGHYSDKPVQYDDKRHGGYYTQDEIKEMVIYAAERGVTIIPEIEMPGHATAALAAYPELACTPGPFTVATTWGVFDDIFCPTETTFTFLQDVMDEVMVLFPSKYIHIGGDEVPKKRWKQSAFCQSLMKKEGLKNEEELQSYFIRRIETYLNSKGREIIGWDEILEGGLAPNATVMSWRGVQGGIEAARQGHDVIMTPGPPLYFDHYQSDPEEEPVAIGGYAPLDKVYDFDPVPSGLSDQESRHILGAQGNLWTEYIADPDHAEYMAYPRAIALSEALWTPRSEKNWSEFVLRLARHLERLDGLGVNYARHFNAPEMMLERTTDGITITWKAAMAEQNILISNDENAAQWDTIDAGLKTFLSDTTILFYKNIDGPTRKIAYTPSKLKQASIKVHPDPDERYPGRLGIETLADGLTGNRYYNGRDWCAWTGNSFTIDIEFPDTAQIDSITLGMLSSPLSWIYPPESLDLKGSTDGINYQTIAIWEYQPLSVGRHGITLRMPGTQVRYLRFVILPFLHIPEGKPGAGSPAWTFIDEIAAY